MHRAGLVPPYFIFFIFNICSDLLLNQFSSLLYPDYFNSGARKEAGQTRPVATVPTRDFCCLNRSSAILSSLSTLHRLPLRILMPTVTSFRSLQPLYCRHSLVEETSNSFTKHVKKSCSAFEVQYNEALLRILGSHSNLRK